MPDVPAAGGVLRAQVPDGIFTLAVEADDVAAAAEHAAFAGRCCCTRWAAMRKRQHGCELN